MCVQIMLLLGSRCRIAVQLKLLLWPAFVVYAVIMYTSLLMLVGQWGLDGTVAVVLLSVSCIQLAATTAAIIAQALT